MQPKFRVSRWRIMAIKDGKCGPKLCLYAGELPMTPDEIDRGQALVARLNRMIEADLMCIDLLADMDWGDDYSPELI